MKNSPKKLSALFLSVFFFILFFAKKTLAICPICTVAVGAGVGFSRWLGIDDIITGLWVGGLTVSLIDWTITWLEKKNIRFKGKNILTILGYYALILIPLYYSGFIGHSHNSLLCWCGFHLDKLLLGIIVGSLGFQFGASFYYYLKEKNQGHAYFPFQKVLMPIAPLILLSLIFFLLLK